jgi:hypothetical protein
LADQLTLPLFGGSNSWPSVVGRLSAGPYLVRSIDMELFWSHTSAPELWRSRRWRWFVSALTCSQTGMISRGAGLPHPALPGIHGPGLDRPLWRPRPEAEHAMARR